MPKARVVPATLTTLAIVLLLATAAWGQYAENTLYAFTGGSDGSRPEYGSLILDAKGNLYGTANAGGNVTSDNCGGGGHAYGSRKRRIHAPVPDTTLTNGCGVVFELTPGAGGAWTETVLYSFMGEGDGQNPEGGLVFDSAGNLYGTTYTDNNALGFGTVFELTPTASGPWNLTTLYTFTGGADGRNPYSTLIFDSLGNLYGTTAFGGGDADSGVVFKLTSSTSAPWTETVLYTFSGGNDGGNPFAGVTFDASGNLYGTAEEGGNTDDCTGSGCGVVFMLTPAASGPWTETVLYAFSGGADGGEPMGNVIFDASGDLYGTAENGGVSDCDGTCGVVFKLAPATSAPWTESVLHTFTGGADGNFPLAGVIFDSSGNLYSTASEGGTSDGCDGPCFGVVFELTPTASGPWNETVLYTFTNSGDGNEPEAGLVFDATGNLYGTTFGGGADGLGVVFELAVPALPSTTTTVTSSLNPSTFGQAVTFTATVTPEAESVAGKRAGHSSLRSWAAAIPTGTVAFTSNGTIITGCSAVTLASEVATCTTSGLPGGTDSIVATYSGDTNYAGSASSSLAQVVEMAATSTIVVSSLNPSTFDQAVSFTATIAPFTGGGVGAHELRFPMFSPQTPTGTVAFTSNGTTISGCAALALSSSGTAQCATSALPTGTDAIVATYSGDANYSGSRGDLSQVVNQVTTATVLASSLNPSTVDQSVALTATISPGTPTGTVGFTSNGATI
ncbi:MAG: choice-of-anchor tandem repeat GloVer-containing protein, partial [Terriglobales bacterium]